MRTLDEILANIEQSETAVADSDEYQNDQDAAFTSGLIVGFKTALRMTKQYKTPAEILEHARADEREYVSVGNDNDDAFQSGFTTALLWAAEEFDWDESGKAIKPHVE